MASTLYILYNADASVMGKLSYGYKKLTSNTKDGPVCAACDITHGGLHLDETAGWTEAKRQVAKEGGLEIKQLHRDELDEQTKKYVESNHLRFPVVLSGNKEGALKVVVDNSELTGCTGDPEKFVTVLREKGVLSLPGENPL